MCRLSKILVLLLCSCLKAPLEPQQLLQTRQILEYLSVVLRELPASPVLLCQELSRRGIQALQDPIKMQNMFWIDETIEYLHTNLIKSVCNKLEIREASALNSLEMEMVRYIDSDLELKEIYYKQILAKLRTLLRQESSRRYRGPEAIKT